MAVDLNAVNEVIIAGLKLWVPKITDIRLSDQKGRRAPAYPYVSFKWTVPYIPEGAVPERQQEAVASKDPRWEYDVQYTYVRRPTATLSVGIYDSASSQKIDALAMGCREWFEIDELGPVALERLRVSVVDVTAIHNRDVHFAEDWERRRGFDVTMRLLDTTTWRVPTIESVQYDGPQPWGE